MSESDSVSLPLGALPVEAMLSDGFSEAKRRIDAALRSGLPRALGRPTFYAVGGGWRALAKAHIEAVQAPVKVVHGYTLGVTEAREFAKSICAAQRGEIGGDAGGAGTARAHAAGGGAAAGPGAQAFGLASGSSSPLWACARGCSIRSSARKSNISIPSSRGRSSSDCRWRGCPISRRNWSSWTANLVSGETPAEARLRVAVCALSDIAWRDPPDLRAEESFRRLLQFPFIGVTHAERVFVAAAIHARYAGRPDAPWLSPAIGLMGPAESRRAQILGRAILLAYRFSGGVPAVLASARLRIEPDLVRLEVAAAARAPDSEVVADRLKLLANAVGVKRSEIVADRGGAIAERRKPVWPGRIDTSPIGREDC